MEGSDIKSFKAKVKIQNSKEIQTTMKALQTILIIVFVGIFSSAMAQADTIKVQTQTHCDHCKKCGSCWPKMEKELTFTPGVKGISFDEKNNGDYSNI